MTGEPIKYPDPWLIDSEFLLQRTRQATRIDSTRSGPQRHSKATQPKQRSIQAGATTAVSFTPTPRRPAFIQNPSRQTTLQSKRPETKLHFHVLFSASSLRNARNHPRICKRDQALAQLGSTLRGSDSQIDQC